MSTFTLKQLEAIIADRASSGDETSWTAKLLKGGTEKCAKKMGEEAVETVIAAVSQDDTAFVGESADLFYHWLVLAKARGIALDDVLAELERRTAQSGIAEKASRKAD